MATASSVLAAADGVKSCLCGSMQQSSPANTPSSSGGLGGLVPRVRPGVGGHKCRICRTKPRFFLRSQRSLDLGTDVPGAVITPVSHAGSPARATTAEPLRRRARSAERYDGMRINTDQPQPSLELYFVRAPPRQASLQSPQTPAASGVQRAEEQDSRRADAMSPPPDYSPPNSGSRLPASMLATPASPPPTYEEAEMSKALSPPSYEESVAQTWGAATSSARQQQQQAQMSSSVATLQMSAGNYQPQQQHACSCSKCKASSAASARMLRAGLAAAPELRVALPPEGATAPTTQYLRAPGAGALSASSHDQCSCYKCQSRYSSSYGDHMGDNDVLLTLETQTAMQGILTDGVALCSLV